MCSVDEVRWRYFEEIGYDRTEAERCFARGRTPAEKLAYGQPFEVYAIRQIMADRSLGVIDFGASNSVYDDAGLLAQVKAALTGAVRGPASSLEGPGRVGADACGSARTHPPGQG